MESKPDLIVAIDYGMTCTGVAYALQTQNWNVRYIQRWPGRSQANENKVPTIVVYDRINREVSSWGFQSETRTEQNNPHSREYCYWFKTYLDTRVLRRAQERDAKSSPQSEEAVNRWTEDYLRRLYGHVSERLASELPSNKTWPLANVEFIFSVPTTWSPHPTVEKFRQICLRAGWGSERNHVVKIGLTEAEAAAVYVACEASVIFREGENLLVCDAGGGTTDLSIMQVTGAQRGVPQLKQLKVVDGRNIGSSQIDQDFEDLVLDRLRRANAEIPMHLDLESTAWSMMKNNKYQDAKCSYGSPDDLPFRVPIESLEYGYQNPQFGIQDGAMLFALEDLRGLFDRQIKGLFELIDAQLKSFEMSHPYEQVAHLVLSGGLGNSFYVQRRLRERYGMNVNTFPNARNLSVHVSPEPQLAVCKGICFDQVKKLEGGRAILGWRCCRASYGTDCKILYDKKNPRHHGLRTEKDPLDGKDYIMSGVAWFIKKGEPINVNAPIIEKFSRKIKPGDPRRAFSDQVITSLLDKEFLPLQVNGSDARKLCCITSDLSRADEKSFKKKNRHWWNFKEAYMRVEYEVRVMIGAADINFELWFEGQKLSRDQPIQVDWSPAEDRNMPETPESIRGPHVEPAVHMNGFRGFGYGNPNYGNHNGFGQVMDGPNGVHDEHGRYYSQLP